MSILRAKNRSLCNRRVTVPPERAILEQNLIHDEGHSVIVKLILQKFEEQERNLGNATHAIRKNLEALAKKTLQPL